MNASAAFETHWIWLGAVGVALAAGLIAFLALLLRRHQNLILGALRRADALLNRLLPDRWGPIGDRLRGVDGTYVLLGGLLALVLGGFFVFAGITEGWRERGEFYALDQLVQQALSGALGEGAVQALRVITHAADLPVALAIGAALSLYLWKQRQRWRLLALALALGIGEAILWGMKFIFARPRPEQQLTSAAGDSFPSGHSFTAMVLYGFLIYLTWRLTRNDVVRTGVTALLSALIVTVAASRVLLSVHWVSDVVGGLVLGLAWLVFSLVAAKALELRHRRRGVRLGS